MKEYPPIPVSEIHAAGGLVPWLKKEASRGKPFARKEVLPDGKCEGVKTVKLVIPIVPKAQMRARHAVVNGFSRTYKDPRQAREEEALMSLLGKHQPAQPMRGPLLLGVKAYLPIPASKPKAWKAAALAGSIRPTVKPDLDNLLKHVKDCLSMLRFWEDDRQVVGYLPHTGKWYSDSPRWELEIVEHYLQGCDFMQPNLLAGCGRKRRECGYRS